MNTAEELNNGMTMCFVGKFGSYGHGWNPPQNSRPMPQNQNVMITTALALFDLYHRLCNLIGSYCNEWRPLFVFGYCQQNAIGLYEPLHDDNLLF